MNNLDDSGYGTPPKHSYEASSNKRIEFVIQDPSNQKDSFTVTAYKTDTLSDALKQNYPKMMKNVENMLVWAEIRNHSGPKCVNPFLLPCGFIEQGTTIETKIRTETVYDYSMQLENTTPYSKTQDRSSVFFVAIANRENVRAITKVHYNQLRHRDICVFAAAHQTFREALEADRRFVGVEYFTLKQKKIEGGATIAMDQKPSDFSKEHILEVKVNKTAPPMTTMHKSTPSTSTAETTIADTAEKSDRETPRPKRNLDKLTETLWTQNAVYVFSRGSLTSKQMFSEMEDCLRARAKCTLLGPQELKAAKFEKSLKKLANIQFANHGVIARPIRITRTLVELSASIGFLICGSITATCFLVKRNMIVTNGHVVTRIKEARRESNAYDHSEVLVHFDHEGNAETLSNGHKLKPFPYQENVISEELDYAFLYLENPTEGKVELGDYIRRKVPEKGSVCIVGHPNGEEKKEEVCPILPLHRDRRALKLESRLREKDENYRNSPSAAALHMYIPHVRRLYGDKAKLTYDVGSMLEGSSGAPVFDMSCNIVAVHTHGFRLEESSIVEVGVTFQAIIKNLEETGYEEFVRENFPNHEKDEDEKMEDEDVDTDETMDTD